VAYDGAEMGGKKEYISGSIAIGWEPSKCIHSGVCVRSLPGVFQPKERPWIKVNVAADDQVTAAIDRCPSGALTWRRKLPTE